MECRADHATWKLKDDSAKWTARIVVVVVVDRASKLKMIYGVPRLRLARGVHGRRQFAHNVSTMHMTEIDKQNKDRAVTLKACAH